MNVVFVLFTIVYMIMQQVSGIFKSHVKAIRECFVRTFEENTLHHDSAGSTLTE